MTTTNLPESLPEPKQIPSKSKPPDRFSELLSNSIDRLQLSPEALILLSAFCIGGGSGLAMVLFHWAIDMSQTLSFDLLMGQLSILGHWTIIFIPTLGGLIVGLMRSLFPEFLGNGLSSLLSNIRELKVSPWRPIVKMLAAAISLGTGASLGPEGPSVEIGSNIGILLGQRFQVSQERYRLLLGAGAAAGLAAGFNAPIAGVFFALEVILGTSFTTPAISLLLLSAVVSAVITHLFIPIHSGFQLPPYQLLSHWEWIFYLGLGLLASGVSIVYTQSIKLLQACFQGRVTGFKWLSKLPSFLYPALGGLCVGAIGIKIAPVLGIGYGTLQMILEGEEHTLSFLAILLVVKLFLTAISLGSGFVGGIFAPALFLGACLGAIYGNILTIVVPDSWFPIGQPAAYAMVGMAAVLASSVRAPLTAILLMFELTGNYSIILPLMAAVGVSVWLVELFKTKQVVQGLNLPQMGLNLIKLDERSILQQMPISSLMDRSYLALKSSLGLIEAGYQMLDQKCHTALVIDDNHQLVGIVSLADIKRQLLQMSDRVSIAAVTGEVNDLEISLYDICTKEIIYAYAHESVAKALERMAGRGLHLLPVVSPDNRAQIIAIISKYRIDLAGELAIAQEALRPYLVCNVNHPTLNLRLSKGTERAC
jgi:H+/Cl- antiporter ClcA/CBS domain-containing protein